MIAEARQLLEGYLRDGIPIEHVFSSFSVSVFKIWGPPGQAGRRRELDRARDSNHHVRGRGAWGC
jgi:hypothetical protein